MSYSQVFKQSWRLAWNLRVLWIFGFLLALTSSGGIWWLGTLDNNTAQQAGITVYLPDEQVWHFFRGEGLRIDLTTPGQPKFLIQQGFGWVELQEITWPEWDLGEVDLSALLIFLAIEAGVLLLLTILLRYTSESAVIRSVNLHAATGEKPSFTYSLRQGWSRTAWRLFVIDLVIFLVVTIVMLAILLVAASPLLLWGSGNTFAGIIGTILSAVLFFPWILLFFLVVPATSLLREVFWRACAVGEVGAPAAIGKGFSVIRHNFAEVIVTWLIWVGIDLVWLLAAIPLFIILSPLFVVGIMIGAVLCIVPGLIVAGISSLFFSGITAWLMGALVAVPIFLVAIFSPITFLAGFVRLFRSNLWTLTYRELPSLKQVEPAVAAQTGAPLSRPATL